MCVNEDTCKFFEVALRDTPQIIVEGYKRNYCHAEHTKCARKIVAGRIGRENVPVELGPHQATEAMSILAQHGESRPSQYFL